MVIKPLELLYISEVTVVIMECHLLDKLPVQLMPMKGNISVAPV